jgi:hypothetical protein
MMIFGEKREKELPGLRLIKKLKISSIVKLTSKLDGFMMEN